MNENIYGLFVGLTMVVVLGLCISVSVIKQFIRNHSELIRTVTVVQSEETQRDFSDIWERNTELIGKLQNKDAQINELENDIRQKEDAIALYSDVLENLDKKEGDTKFINYMGEVYKVASVSTSDIPGEPKTATLECSKVDLTKIEGITTT